MKISKKLEKLKQQVDDLLAPVSLDVTLEVIANYLEIEYSKHKNTEQWVEDVSQINTSNEVVRRSMYFVPLNGPLNELLKTKIRAGKSNCDEISGELQKIHIEESFRISGMIRWLTASEALISKYNWKEEQTSNGIHVMPSNEYAENAIIDFCRDTETFHLFGGMGSNMRKVARMENAQSPNIDFEQLLAEEKTLYPENLMPEGDESITESTVKALAGSPMYHRYVRENELEFYEFLAPGLDQSNEKIMLKVPEGEVDVKDAINVMVLLSQMARLQVAQIDRYVMGIMKRAQEEALRAFPEANLYAMFRARAMRNESPERIAMVKHLQDSQEVLNAQAYQSEYVEKHLRRLKTLSSYKIEELGAWIADALNMSRDKVISTFSILDFVRSAKGENALMSFQALFCIKKKIYWLPNALAYTSPAEMIFNTMISQDLLKEDHQLSRITERAVYTWFKGAGFKIFAEDDDHKYYDDKDKLLGDFDAMAYKDGHLYHFEIKLTHTRNDLMDKMSYKQGKFSKARKQLSQGRAYISSHKAAIAKRLGLDPGEQINEYNFHSYVVSNSFDFDKQRIHKYLKFSLRELYVALHEAGHLMCVDEGQILKHSFLRIKHLLKVPIPPAWQEWIDMKVNLPSTEEHLVRNFTTFHLTELKEQLTFRSTHPLWAVENNWYTVRDQLPIDPIRHFVHNIDGQEWVLPEI